MIVGSLEPVAPKQPRCATPGVIFSWRAATVSLVCIALVVVMRVLPPLPSPLEFEVYRSGGAKGQLEPLITTGHFEYGDFLTIEYENDAQARIGYDAWGSGGPKSDLIPFAINTRHRVAVKFPGFYMAPGAATGPKAPMQVWVDGNEVLRADVEFHYPFPDEIYFGRNPNGGTPGARLQGTVSTVDGIALSRGAQPFFPWTTRLSGLLTSPYRIAGVVLLTALFGWLVPLLRTKWRQPTRWSRTAWSAAVGGVLLTATFAYIVTDETWAFIYPESFGSFYDFQALSLVHGRLDVPEASLSGESFFFGGKCFGYFGPTPAVLRIPLLLLGVPVGVLSRPMMVFEYAVCLAAIYALFVRIQRLVQPGRPVSAAAALVFLLTAGAGSTLFFLGSRAYIYHEAILCGAACGLWACYFTIQYADSKTMRAWLLAVALGTLAVHSRPPLGFLVLCFTGAVALMNAFRDARHQVARHLLVGVFAAVGIVSFNGVSYLKFHTIEGCPLRYNVQYSGSRLARIEGKQFHLSNLRFGLHAYVLHPSLRFTRHFPFVESAGATPSEYPEAKNDIAEPMAGIPWAMPGLTLLAIAGFAAIPSLRADLRLLPLVVWISAIPAACAMFAAIAVSHRYTADFLPWLVTSAAFGLAAMERSSPKWRVLQYAAGVFSVFITLALTISFQGEGVWGVPAETRARYMHLKARVDALVQTR